MALALRTRYILGVLLAIVGRLPQGGTSPFGDVCMKSQKVLVEEPSARSGWALAGLSRVGCVRALHGS